MKDKNTFHVLGLMSGTSLDGLDVACCRFSRNKSGWEYVIENATTVRYTSTWRNRLAGAHNISGEELIKLDADYGRLLGKTCREFIETHKLRVDFIASHGHTIFHQPEKGFTWQLGNGNAIHSVSDIPVVYDFRSLDVMLGGEGAPLVPAGDKFLFQEYDVCLNLGGIANASMDVKGSRIAWDICFCNMGLNYLASKAGKEIDRDGNMANAGEINEQLLMRLNKIYQRFKTKRPSLGREIFEKQIQPLLDEEKIPLKDRLRTFTESAAQEITAAVLSGKKNPGVLCTGGGAFNSFLISRMLEQCHDEATLIIPEPDVINFKEALVFAFLGVLRITGNINCLKSVTHASRDNSGGVLAGF